MKSTETNNENDGGITVERQRDVDGIEIYTMMERGERGLVLRLEGNYEYAQIIRREFVEGKVE